MLTFASFREAIEYHLIAIAEAMGPDYCAAFKTGPCIRPDHLGVDVCNRTRMALPADQATG